MRNILRCCAFLAAVAVVVPNAAAGELKLSMQDGRVSIVATDVPLRQILQEWARVGQTTIVNGDKLIGANISIQLTNVPEKEALDILLRSAAGYIAAPRPTLVAGAATYDRITIMATSRAPAAVASAPVPTFQRPPAAPADDGDEPINVTMPPQPQNPVTGQFPGMPPGMQPGMQPNPTNMPVTGTQPGPLTSPRPGALPAPAMPAGYPNPYQQPPVVRPGPGGGPGGPGGGPGGPGGQ